MEDFFNALIRELQLNQAGPDESYGERGNQPLILTYLSADPPAIMFQIRVNTENKHELHISEYVSELSEQDDIKISVENGYGWLTIYNFSDYTIEDVVGLLDLVLQALVDNQLNLDEKCAICQNSKDVTIRYSEGKVSRTCESCAGLVEQKRLEKEKELGRRKYIYAIFIPVGVIIFALGWVLFWVLFDWSFSLSKVDSVDITDIGLVGVSIVVAIALGLPVGFLLKKLCIWKHNLLAIIATSLVIMGFVLGEIIHLSILIYREFRVIDIMASIQSLPYFWKNSSEGAFIITVVILIFSIVIICIVAKTKKPTVEI